MSWKVAVKVFSEPQWNYNAQRFATREEAQSAGESLSSLWTAVEKFEVQESPTDPVNYKMSDGRAVMVENHVPEIVAPELDVSSLEPEPVPLIARKGRRVAKPKPKRKSLTFGDGSSMQGLP